MSVATALIDRDLVKALVLQGLSNKEVCIQTGVADNVLRAWKCRYGWNELLRKARAQLVTVSSERVVNRADSALVAKSEAVKNAIAVELEADLAVIQGKRGKTLKTVAERQQVLSTMAGTGKIVFAWSDGSSTSVINIALLESMRSVDPVRTVPVLDCQSVPVPASVEPIKHALTEPSQPED